MKRKFSRQVFEKNTQIRNFMKIRPAGAELFHSDGRTDMTKVIIVAFRNILRTRLKVICWELSERFVNGLVWRKTDV